MIYYHEGAIWVDNDRESIEGFVALTTGIKNSTEQFFEKNKITSLDIVNKWIQMLDPFAPPSLTAFMVGPEKVVAPPKRGDDVFIIWDKAECDKVYEWAGEPPFDTL